MIANNYLSHRHQIELFVDETVGLILQQLTQKESDQYRPHIYEEHIRESLHDLLIPFASRTSANIETISSQFAAKIPDIVEDCWIDAQRYPICDPALECLEEVFYASNGYWATVAYRIANALLKLKAPIIPRTVSGIAHSRTGVDIHPGTTIAPGLFIDHGTGIAIGCTAVIEANVSLYNGVVLGTSGKPRKKVAEDSGEICKRHPTISQGVSLYTSCFVGGDVVIGENSIIGAFAFVCDDIPEDSVVQGTPGISSIRTCQKRQQAIPTTSNFSESRDQSFVR